LDLDEGIGRSVAAWTYDILVRHGIFSIVIVIAECLIGEPLPTAVLQITNTLN